MRPIAPLALAAVACLPAGQPAVAPFDSARAFEDLKQIVAIGPRPAGSAGARQARDYIRRAAEAAGLAVAEPLRLFGNPQPEYAPANPAMLASL